MDFTTPQETISETAFKCRTNIDNKFMLLTKKILEEGEVCHNRTGIDTKAIAGHMLEHNMFEGFPLLTVKKCFSKAIFVELEGFIKGITDKRWYQERGCNFWNQWSNPASDDTNDLGKIYGYQARKFNDDPIKGDQLKIVIDRLMNEKTANDRRLIVSHWNPLQLDCMSIPPCHILYNFIKLGNTLNLIWYQRSTDTMLGFPANCASYALLLALVCKMTGYISGKVIGMLGNVHIYENHLEPIITKLIPQAIANKDNITDLPKLIIKDSFTDIFNFDALRDVEIIDYKHDPYVKMSVAI